MFFQLFSRHFFKTSLHIGTLGQKNNWAMDESVLDLSKLPQIIPEDVRRVASANTLRTVKGGVHTQWKMVKNALAFLRLDVTSKADEAEGLKTIRTPFGVIKKRVGPSKADREKLEAEANNKNNNDSKNNDNSGDIKVGEALPGDIKIGEIKNNTPKIENAKTSHEYETNLEKIRNGELKNDANSLGANKNNNQLGQRRSSMKIQKPIRRPSMTTIWMEDVPMKTVMEFQQSDKVEQTYQKLVKHGITSSVLGKYGWKKKFRRERAPLAANYERLNAPGDGLRPPLAPVAQLTLQGTTADMFTVSKHTPVRWEAKHAIVYSRLPFATLDTGRGELKRNEKNRFFFSFFPNSPIKNSPKIAQYVILRGGHGRPMIDLRAGRQILEIRFLNRKCPKLTKHWRERGKIV